MEESGVEKNEKSQQTVQKSSYWLFFDKIHLFFF